MICIVKACERDAPLVHSAELTPRQVLIRDGFGVLVRLFCYFARSHVIFLQLALLKAALSLGTMEPWNLVSSSVFFRVHGWFDE